VVPNVKFSSFDRFYSFLIMGRKFRKRYIKTHLEILLYLQLFMRILRNMSFLIFIVVT